MFVSASIYLDALFLLLGDNSSRSRDLVKELLIATDRIAHKGREIISADNELIEVYRGLIKSVLDEKISQEDSNASKILLLKIKSSEALRSHPIERDLLTDVLTAQEAITAQMIDGYLRRIRNALILAEFDDFGRKLFARTRKISDIMDTDAQEHELREVVQLLDNQVKVIERRQNSSDSKGSETYVSLSDKDSILRALNTFMDRNIRGVIRTGLQGLNKALGSRGGFGLGESVVFAASSHNYKSGMLVSIMLWSIIYNDFSKIVEPGRKPMVYFVSLENEVSQNLMDVFKALYCRVEKRNVDLNELTPEVITNWLQEYFSQFGVELFIDRYQPHDFSFGKFILRYNAFVEMGYQIMVFDLDYMSEARGVDPGDTISGQGQIQLIKENYLKFVNHAKSQGYLLATGHQLTKKAEELSGQYKYAVKKFNPSLMADSSDVHRIVDMLFFLQLESNLDNVKFLLIQNRKNRGCKDTPEQHKFCAYAFTPFGIEDDLNDLPRYVTDYDDWSLPSGIPTSSAQQGLIAEEALF